VTERQIALPLARQGAFYVIYHPFITVHLGVARMSRAINVNAEVKDVQALCAKHDIAISTIEPLTSGGTRVVLLNPIGADRIRELLSKKIITEAIVRSPLHMARQPAPRYR
jgi:hypothetical protein